MAERLFFETVVRLHRQGEGAAFTGLKPAGLDVGPVIPLAEEAVETGSPEDLTTFLGAVLTDELHRRLTAVSELGDARNGSVERERQWVSAMLGFQVYSHHLFQALESPAHAHDETPEATEAPGHGHEHVH